MESPQQTISTVMTNYHNFQGNFNLDKSGFDPKMPRSCYLPSDDYPPATLYC